MELERVLEKFDFIEKIYSSDVNFLLLKLKRDTKPQSFKSL